MNCDILFTTDGIGPKDKNGCHLPNGHAEPHEFIAEGGATYQWETDWACDCDHCMRCEGDYCTIYWERPSTQEGGEK